MTNYNDNGKHGLEIKSKQQRNILSYFMLPDFLEAENDPDVIEVV